MKTSVLEMILHINASEPNIQEIFRFLMINSANNNDIHFIYIPSHIGTIKMLNEQLQEGQKLLSFYLNRDFNPVCANDFVTCTNNNVCFTNINIIPNNKV